MVFNIIEKIFGSENDRILKQLNPIVDKINGLEPQMQQYRSDNYCISN